MAVGIPAADREWDRTTITRTKERVKNLRHVSDEERAQIQSSATRAALAVELELGRAKSPYADHWPYVLSVAAGLVLTAAGLIAAMHADLNLVNGPAFLVPGSIEGEVSVLAPVPLPITPSQIAVVVAVSAFVAGASYWAAWREDHAPLLPYFTTLPLLFGAYILGGGIPLVTDSVITSFIAASTGCCT